MRHLGSVVDLVPAHAAHPVVADFRPAHIVHPDDSPVAAPVLEEVAARSEVAAGGALVGERKLSSDGLERRGVLVRGRQRNAAEEAVGVGMLRPGEQGVDGAFLHHLARVHHEDAVADLEDQAEVVGDVDLRGAVLAADVGDELGDARFHRHVQCGGGLVEKQQGGVGEQGHRDDHPLLLATRDLVRIGVHHPFGVRQAHVAEHLERPLGRFRVADSVVGHRHFLELGAEQQAGIERRERLLVDHRDVGSAQLAELVGAELVELQALEPDAAALDASVAAHVLHDGHRHRGLAAAGLAHQSDTFSPVDGEGEVDDRGDLSRARPVGEVEVLDLQDRGVLVELEGHGCLHGARRAPVL